MRPFLFLVFLEIALTLQAQSYEASFTNKPLSKALKEVIKTYDLKISYSPSLLKNYTITKEVRAHSPSEMVTALLQDLPFEVKSQRNLLLIVPKRPTAVSGQIVDKSTGTPLAFALVQSEKNNAVADQNGYFALPLSKDTVTLKVSYLGYKKLDFQVSPDESSLEINMEQNPLILQEVILDVNKKNKPSFPVSAFTLNPRQFNSLPVLGETDVFKTLQLLPGISATNESTSGFNVRGSSASHNLVLMDGFTLYHLDHFFGIFSTLNPNFINTIDIYKGGFSAEYGGRVSSVVDVSSRPGNRDKINGGAGINFLSTNFYLDIPVGNKINLMAGLRNSFTGVIESGLYSEFLTSSRQNFISSFDDPEITSLELSPSLNFYDVNAKLTYRPSDKTSINASLYVSEDDYQGLFVEEDDFIQLDIIDKADWSNAGLSLNLNQSIQQNQVLGVSLSASEFSNAESLSSGFSNLEAVEFAGDSIFANTLISGSSFVIDNQVSDVSLKLSHEWYVDADSEFKTGLELNSMETFFASTFTLEDFFADSINEPFGDSLLQNANITSLYGSYSTRFGRFSPTIGVRTNFYDLSNEWYTEPRINLAYQLSDRIQLKGAYSTHHQFLNQSSLSYVNSGRYYWLLSDNEVVPVLKSRHLIFGSHYDFQNWRLEAEFYRRRTTGLTANRFLTIPPDVFETLSQNGEIDISGENVSRGMELFIKYKNRRFNSWISYSLASSRDRYNFLNENEFFPSDEDQRHEVNFVNVLKLGRWELASTIIYGSGRPFTPQVSDENANDSFFYEDISRINSERFDPYRRIDLSAKYSFPLFKASGEMGVSFFNLFGFRNIKSRRYVRQYIFSEQFNETVADEIRIVPLDTYLLGFTPNFFLNLRF